MKRLSFLLLLFMISGATATVFSQQTFEPRWDLFTTENGLADNYIWMTADDGKGCVWAATLNGISRFDGKSWASFSIPLPFAATGNIISLSVDQSGVVWCANRLGWIYSYDRGRWKVYKDGPYNPMSIAVDHHNVIWVTTSDRHLWSYDGVSWNSRSIPIDNQPWPLCIDPDNALWVGSNGGGSSGVACYDGKSWRSYTHADGLADNRVFGIAAGAGGTIWFATAAGVSRLSQGEWSSWNERDGLLNDESYSVSIDRAGVVWVGHPEGLSRFENGEWKQYTSENSGFPPAMRAFNIVADERNGKWISPTLLGTNGLLRLVDREAPYLLLTAPNGGDILESGKTALITWDTWGVNTITIEYSLDDGAAWNTIASGVDAASGSFFWSVPEIETPRLRIRIRDAFDSTMSDVSTGDVLVSRPFIRVVEPAGGEGWSAGTEHQIAWTATGVQNVRVEYSSDGGTIWNLISEVSAAAQYLTWNTPSVMSSRYTIRITDVANAGLSGSSGLFAVNQPYLRILSPSGGEKWEYASQIITWISEGVDLVKVSYSRDGGETWVTSGENIAAAPGYYFWYGEVDRPAQYRFMVSDMSNAAIADTTERDSYIVVRVSEKRPSEFTVFPNSPNPFNPGTTITFALPTSERVKVDVYNLSGQRVGTVLDRRMEPGKHSVVWNAGGLSAGVYLGLVRAGAEVKTIKMLLLK